LGKRWLKALACLLAAVALVALGRLSADWGGSHLVERPAELRIAYAPQVSTASLLIARDLNFLERHHITVADVPAATGRHALDALLAGQADLALVADTPVMFAVMQGKKVTPLASVFASRSMMGVVARRDRGIATPGDLRGKTVATPLGTNAQFFLDTLLTASEVPRATVLVHDYRADKLGPALRDGSVDAVTVWQPELTRLQQEMGDSVVTLSDDTMFVSRLLLVGEPDFVQSNQRAIRQLLSALGDAMDFIHAQPEQAERMLGRTINMAPGLLAPSFKPMDYYLSLDDSVLRTLSEQTRWAMRQQMVPQGPVPDYLNMIDPGPLREARPGAVKFVR
jgi:NitT/TauT family transport system substrate-binding protein